MIFPEISEVKGFWSVEKELKKRKLGRLVGKKGRRVLDVVRTVTRSL